MKSHVQIAVLVVFAGGCSSGTGPLDDERVQKVLVPGYTTPSLVLYTRGDSRDCRAITKHSVEIADSADRQPFLENYVSVRTPSIGQGYRAFFKPDRIAAAPYESAFILCSNNSTPISMYCGVMGAMPNGCFYTSYGWYKLSEIELLIQRIRAEAPTWVPSAAPNNSFKPTPLRSLSGALSYAKPRPAPLRGAA